MVLSSLMPTSATALSISEGVSAAPTTAFGPAAFILPRTGKGCDEATMLARFTLATDAPACSWACLGSAPVLLTDRAAEARSSLKLGPNCSAKGLCFFATDCSCPFCSVEPSTS